MSENMKLLVLKTALAGAIAMIKEHQPKMPDSNEDWERGYVEGLESCLTQVRRLMEYRTEGADSAVLGTLQTAPPVAGAEEAR